jgi:hypothetical protein
VGVVIHVLWKDLRSDNRDGKADSVQSAGCAKGRRVGDLVTLVVGAKALLGVGRSVTKRSLNIASA